MRRLWATIQTYRPDTEILRQVQAKSSRLETLRDSGGGEAMSVSDSPNSLNDWMKACGMSTMASKCQQRYIPFICNRCASLYSCPRIKKQRGKRK